MRPPRVVMRWTHPRHGSVVEVLCSRHESELLRALKMLAIGCSGTGLDAADGICGRCRAELVGHDPRRYVLTVARGAG